LHYNEQVTQQLSLFLAPLSTLNLMYAGAAPCDFSLDQVIFRLI